MIEWVEFNLKNEDEQARTLLKIAYNAWTNQNDYPKIKTKIIQYINVGYQFLEGDIAKLPFLLRFLDDPEMEADFSVFYEYFSDNDKASAALDLASYACGFVSRMVAMRENYSPLPDPVLESVPDIYEYFKEKAEFLNL